MLSFIRVWTLGIMALVVTCAAAQASPSAVIQRVRLMPRADLSTAAWLRTTDTYRPDYVYPRSRAVRLSGCGSREDAATNLPAVSPTLSWSLEPLEGQVGAVPFMVVAARGTCSTDTALRAMGRWRVTLTATDAAGLTAQASRELVFRDMLVVAIGDSFTSGEGNKVRAPGDVGRWVDRQCHRSYNAWPAFVARSLENDTTAVTYLNLACSGADVSNVIDKPYEGPEPPRGGATVDPQIKVLRDLIHDPVDPETRPVDVLLGSMGINTIPVAKLLLDCARDSIPESIAVLLDAIPGVGNPECQKDFTREFNRLPRLLDDLELALSANLRIAQVQFVGYPARIMTDRFNNYPRQLTGIRCSLSPSCTTNATLCDVFANTRVADKQWMTKTVDTINAAVTNAGKYRNGWTVTKTRDLFRRHGYCAPAGITWFNSLYQSKRRQGDVNGTAHPTRDGHVATFRAVRPRIRLDAVAPAPDQFVVNVKKLALTLPDQGLKFVEGRPRQVGATRLRVSGATHASCGASIGGNPTPPTTGRTLGIVLSANCTRFTVVTAGKTIQISAEADIDRFIPRRPPDPNEPGVGHVKRVTLDARRRHLRANNWNATVLPPGENPFEPPVQRVVAGGSDEDFGKLVLEYTITRPSTTIGP